MSKSYRRARGLYSIRKHELRNIGKELGLCNDIISNQVKVGNVIAAIRGWNEITGSRARKLKISNLYIRYHLSLLSKKVIDNPKYWVYIIRQRGKSNVKIGVASNIENRIKSLQTGSPYKLSLVAKIGLSSRMEAYNLEKSLHDKFHWCRMEGEWFKSTMLKKLDLIEYKVEWTGKNNTESVINNF